MDPVKSPHGPTEETPKQNSYRSHGTKSTYRHTSGQVINRSTRIATVRSFRFGRRTGRISRVWLASSWSYCHLTSIDRYIDQCQVFSNAHAIRSERKDLSVYQTAIDISHGMGIDKCREETMEAYTAYIAKMHIHELAKEVLPTTYNYEKWLWGQFCQ